MKKNYTILTILVFLIISISCSIEKEINIINNNYWHTRVVFQDNTIDTLKTLNCDNYTKPYIYIVDNFPVLIDPCDDHNIIAVGVKQIEVLK